MSCHSSFEKTSYHRRRFLSRPFILSCRLSRSFGRLSRLSRLRRLRCLRRLSHLNLLSRCLSLSRLCGLILSRLSRRCLSCPLSRSLRHLSRIIRRHHPFHEFELSFMQKTKGGVASRI